MASSTLGTSFHATAKLGPQTTDGLVITCSDRRFREATDEFLASGLRLHNFDRLAVPGGVYMLSFADALPKQLKVCIRMVQYLVKGHLPGRIVLIAHADCGRYRDGFASWIRRPGFSLEEKQRHDLRQVAGELRTMASIPVDAYFARAGLDHNVTFEPV